ncbi:siderophore-interacting protein [Geodermatophilus sp. SYSU D00691]
MSEAAVATATEVVSEVVAAPAYRFFRTTVLRSVRLSPSFVRLTLGGPELAGFGAAGDDQRIKFVLPRDGQPFDELMSSGAGWYADYCALPDERRPFLRTYTVRAFRPEPAELEVDVVLHGLDDGHPGPAATWAAAAAPGDELVVLGPDRPGRGRAWAAEWAPPASARTLVLAGDETAVPAIAAILAGLPAGRRVVALLEVPTPGDALNLAGESGADVRWLPRGDAPVGTLLAPAVDVALAELGIAHRAAAEADLPEVDEATLWEVPDADAVSTCYAWLAGEAGVVKRLRRRLVSELGVPRGAVAFMGYWRQGAAALG